MKIRGPREDVDKCAKHLNKLVKDLSEGSYMIEVPIFQQFLKFIVGKGGANIKKVGLLSINLNINIHKVFNALVQFSFLFILPI